MTKWVAVAVVAVAVVAGAIALVVGRADRQAAVRERGSRVMPFDLDRTTHVFRKTRFGGVQTVLAEDRRDRRQVSLIRQHLRAERARFVRGDFSDPMAIHGATMPGVQVLRRRARELAIVYAETPEGARLRYAARDPELRRALHRWFDAQVADHGHDAHS